LFSESDSAQLANVHPEKLIDYELGYKMLYKNIQLETNLFYMDYENQLVMTGVINNVGAYIMTNVPDSYRTGIEITSNVNLFKSFNWYLTATFSKNKIKKFTSYVDVWETWSQIPEEYEQTDISFSPSITASNEFRYSPLKGLNLILASNFVGRQYVDNTQSVERSIDPYLVHDFKILYDVKVKALKKLQFKLSINNVLNHQYETCLPPLKSFRIRMDRQLKCMIVGW
jgi:iron complex outermembrane receptor protein